MEKTHDTAQQSNLHQENSTPVTWTGQSKGSALGNWIFVKLIELGGPLPAYILLALVALQYTLFDKATRQALDSFRRHVQLPAGFWRIYRHVYCFGVNLIDSIAFLTKRGQRMFRFTHSGIESILQPLDEGKGVILLSAHIGNWEVAANLLTESKNVKVNVVMMDNEREKVRRVLQSATGNRQVEVIAITENPLDMMIQVRKALARNEVVCFLGDRVVPGQDYREVDFLGEKARFPIGPFAIAAITGAPIVAVLTIKESLRRFHHRAYTAIRFDGVTRQNREAKMIEGLRTYVAILEQAVREHPYQWFNFYYFWASPHGGTTDTHQG